MTNEEKTIAEINEDEKPITVNEMIALHGRNVDYFLIDIVHFVEKGKAELSITLNLGGGMVSGIMIDRKKYFKQISNTLSDAFEGSEENRQILKKFFGQRGENDLPEGPPAVMYSYIQLKNAKFWKAGGTIPSGDGMLWRGKINSVSGFALGQIEKSI